jgi:hypothetical protein
MVSARQLAANRRNAKLSTGPSTAIGRNRCKANALRHALTTKTFIPAANSIEIERLASAAGSNPDATRWFFSVIAAEAEMELRRVRAARVRSLVSATRIGRSNDRALQARNFAEVLRELICFDRYERRALSRRNKVLRLL